MSPGAKVRGTCPPVPRELHPYQESGNLENQKIAYLSHPISALYESFNAKKLCSRVLPRVYERMLVSFVKQRTNVSEPPFRGPIGYN